MSGRRTTSSIVGGGSAGCALANRLSADPAPGCWCSRPGRPDYPWDVFIHMPAALTFPIGSRFYDWQYESEPEPHMNGRRIYHARGKVLGGSSSINGMIFQRGNPMDYERWAADPGMETWDFAHCLPYFKRMENCLAAGPDDPFRGHSGPLVLERGPATNPLFGAFFEAVAAGRLPADGRRQRLPAGGLRRVRPQRAPRPPAVRRAGLPAPGRWPRPNLTVRTRAFVTRVLFQGTRAIGVEVARRRGAAPRPDPPGSVERIEAGEVILAGGAINSPQLLQLSGVGDAETCAPLGIDVVHHLPGVGENLQDHLEVYVQHACTQPVSMQPYLKYRYQPWIGAQWLFLRRGPGATQPLRGRRFRPQQRRREPTRT